MKLFSVLFVLLFVSLLHINEITGKRFQRRTRSGSNNNNCDSCINREEPNLEEFASMTLELFRLLDLAAGSDATEEGLYELFIWLSENTSINDENVGLTFSFDGIHPNAGLKQTYYSIDEFVASLELNGLIQERHLFNSARLINYDNNNKNAIVSRYYQHWAQFETSTNSTSVPSPYHIHHNAYSTVTYDWSEESSNDIYGNNVNYNIRIIELNDDWFMADWTYDPSA